MAGIASGYGLRFDRDHPVHGGSHDKYSIGRYCVVVPRHADIAEYTARGILRTFEEMCARSSTEDSDGD
jgi:hypothetical protein